MGKNDSEIVRLAGQHVLDLFSGAGADVPLIYHGYKRSRGLVGDCKEIAKGIKLNGDQGQILLLSAWFHDAGYVTTNGDRREKRIDLARKFLASQGQPQGVADAVASCLEAADDDGVRDSVAGDVLHDALLARLASKSYVEETGLHRREEEQRTGKVYSDVEWTRSRIEYLQQHTYRTRWAQLEYDGGRARNLARLNKQLRRQLGKATEEKAEEAKISKNEGRTAAGLFGDLTRNQLRILSIADRRTSTMIHVNAIMISLVVGLVLRKVEEHRNLIIPTIVLLSVILVVVFLSILSMRAGHELRNLHDETPEQIGNLLLTSDDLRLSLSDYLGRMDALVSNPSQLQRVLFEYLYFGRRLIVHRKKMLRLTYDIFIFGLAVSLLLFTGAILWF